MMADREFDIIIVGGGTAGCVLASRLSAAKELRILLLEAGSDRSNDVKVQVPLTSRQMFKDPDYDWGYETIPQVNLDSRVIEQTRGRMIGGSSAINSHSLVYPNKDMHDTWSRMIDDERWCWDQMKNCYTQFSEEMHTSAIPNTTHSIADSALDRPIKASYPAQQNQLQKAWVYSFGALGMESKDDGPSGKCFGGFTTTNAIDNRPERGERSHAGNGYLQPALSRNNLVVETNALVQRIVFQKNPGHDSIPLTATSVAYNKDGREILAKANREVIICAGAFGSPQLLELSGIGRKKILENAGVECLLDLPGVGENLQDHLNFGPSVEVNSDIETMDAIRNPSTMASYRAQYLKHRTGPLAEGAAYSFAFWPLQLFNSASENDELKQILDSHPTQSPREDFIKRMILSPLEASATVFMTRIQRYTTASSPAAGNYMSIIAMLSHPFSLGSTHITTSNPSTHPQIDPAYLSHPLDAEILSRHVLQIDRLLQQPIYTSIVKPNGTRLPKSHPGPFTSPEEIKSAIRSHGATNYHPCGTCAMMKQEDGGVVNADLRVYGTTNLRVCDASVFPIIPRGNILTTVYAVAERAVEIILG